MGWTRIKPALVVLCANMACATLVQAEAAQELTIQEQQSFTMQIAPCWNVAALGPGEQAEIITVAFKLEETGKPVPDSIELRDPAKVTSQAVSLAFQSARRAIIRCGANGYKLPLEKYEKWRDIEVTFNPERMQFK